MPASDRELVAFLIGQQSTLSDASTGRDLGDPATVRWLTERVGTIERLRLLALLTYAGIASSSSEAMIPWRLDQLLRTYDATYRGLTRELETDLGNGLLAGQRGDDGGRGGINVVDLDDLVGI